MKKEENLGLLIKQRINMILDRFGWTEEQFAKKCGLDPDTVAQLLDEEKNMELSPEPVLQICETLRWPLACFFTFNGEMILPKDFEYDPAKTYDNNLFTLYVQLWFQLNTEQQDSIISVMLSMVHDRNR